MKCYWSLKFYEIQCYVRRSWQLRDYYDTNIILHVIVPLHCCIVSILVFSVIYKSYFPTFMSWSLPSEFLKCGFTPNFPYSLASEEQQAVEWTLCKYLLLCDNLSNLPLFSQLGYKLLGQVSWLLKHLSFYVNSMLWR